MQACIYGLSGLALNDEEIAFFKDADPAGFILFGRNIENRKQLHALTNELRAVSGRDNVPILIDQEGGRVSRMHSPEWLDFPTMEPFERLYKIAPSSALEAARVNARALGLMLEEVGINVDCLPVLDVRQKGASRIVGDRSFGDDPMRVAALGRAVVDGLHSAGVVSVIKHMPGHGRATEDSHKERPVVDVTGPELDIDLFPFEQLYDAPMGMVAHVVYSAWDSDHVASQSKTIIDDIIRGRMNFDGFLISDDLNMQALHGSMAERAAGVLGAGCDVALHCSGLMAEMVTVAEVVPDMAPKGLERLEKAMSVAATDEPLTFDEAVAKRDELLALV